MDLNSALFSMIDQVSQAPDERSAYMNLLMTLLSQFQMDQAAVCESHANDEISLVFGIDHSKRILQSMDGIWLSKTLVIQTLSSMSPVIFHNAPEIEEFKNISKNNVSKSITEYDLKNIVCIPLSQVPARVIYLASRRDPFRKISVVEMEQLRIASKAAGFALQHQIKLQELKVGNKKLKNELESKNRKFIYASSVMESLLSEVARIAPFNISVLIQGESGCGKEELAREIHRLSGRKGPFIAINCANLTESLLESELFGYSKGAFTGAVQSKKGLLQEVDGGTFFMDEIVEIPPNIQAKLLRVLQERTVRPIGSNIDIPIDIRVLAASHVDLKNAVYKKKFRDDLYYRVQEITLTVPSLRERIEDIEIFAQYFLVHFSTEFKLPCKMLSSTALQKLLAHSWPGNVRELKNVCRTAVILGRHTALEPSDLRIEQPIKPIGTILAFQSKTASFNPPKKGEEVDLKRLSSQFERDLIIQLLNEADENQITVAKRLNISVRTLQRILNRESEQSQNTFVE
jgi:transcriptional regulator with PAS, ATPase and Fis domain